MCTLSNLGGNPVAGFQESPRLPIGVSDPRAGLARDWRARFDFQLLSYESRLPEPALIGAIKGQRRAPAQPVFDLCECYELQSTTSNPPQLRSDVLIKEVPTASKRLRGLARGQRQAQWAGNIWLTHRLLQSAGR